MRASEGGRYSIFYQYFSRFTQDKKVYIKPAQGRKQKKKTKDAHGSVQGKRRSCSQKMKYVAELGSPTPSISPSLDLGEAQCGGLISGERKMRPSFFLFLFIFNYNFHTLCVRRNRACRLAPRRSSSPRTCLPCQPPALARFLLFFFFFFFLTLSRSCARGDCCK